MGEESKQADWITPPVRGEVYVVSTSTSAAAVDISALADKNTYVTFQADGAACYVMFASTSATADDLDTTATSGNGRCIKIPADGVLPVKLHGGGTHDFIGYRTASGTGTLRYWVSGPPQASKR